MAKIIPFRKVEKPDKEILKLLKISDEFDAVLLRHLSAGDVDPIDLVGVLAHRLGTLMNRIEEKSELWDVCERVVKKQAALD